jgi:predicted bacteriocin transport accessory protein
MKQQILKQNKKILFMSTLTIVSLIVLLVFVCLLLPSSRKEDKKMLDEYPQLTDVSNIFKTSTVNEINYRIDHKESFLFFLGFPECPWCQAVAPVLNSAGKAMGQDVIYYVNILLPREDETCKDHAAFLELEKKIEVVKDPIKNRINAPTVITIVDGKVAMYHLDTVVSHKVESGILPKMNKEQVEELTQIYKKMMGN